MIFYLKVTECSKAVLYAFSYVLELARQQYRDELQEVRSRGYKTFFMLNPAEHKLLNALKYKNIKTFSIFQAPVGL